MLTVLLCTIPVQACTGIVQRSCNSLFTIACVKITADQDDYGQIKNPFLTTEPTENQRLEPPSCVPKSIC